MGAFGGDSAELPTTEESSPEPEEGFSFGDLTKPEDEPILDQPEKADYPNLFASTRGVEGLWGYLLQELREGSNPQLAAHLLNQLDDSEGGLNEALGIDEIEAEELMNEFQGYRR